MYPDLPDLSDLPTVLVGTLLNAADLEPQSQRQPLSKPLSGTLIATLPKTQSEDLAETSAEGTR